MSRLAIHTLGMPRIEYAGNPLAFDRRKAVALLVYLALSDGVRGRDALATLLWPDYDQASARGNLRRALFVLNAALNEDLLLVERDTVALRRDGGLWVDVQQFERLLGECRTHGHTGDQVCIRCLEPLTQAVALYRDDFLTGFTLADAPDFDDWQRALTENLRATFSVVLERLSRCLMGRGDTVAALTNARRRVALDPLDEAAQRQLMQMLAWAGDRSGALRQYQICKDTLRRELSTTPAPETTALFEAISQNRLPPPVSFDQPPARPLPDTEHGALAPSLSQGQPDAQGELRLVTVLCAGLAGESDPEAAAAGLDRLLASLETILGRYEARLDRLLGDSVVAVFGAQQLHEDDAERAVQSARALVEETRRQASTRFAAQVSVGVAMGEAYFGPVGRGGQATHSVLGPLVNRAARLQGRAAAGQVLADQATYRQTHQAFAYRSPDSAETPASAQVYEVTGALARPAKTRGIEGLRAELIGRDDELAKLEAALARVQAGQGQVMALISEAGLGKSRLVAELKVRCNSVEAATHASIGERSASHTPQSAITWLEGRCLEMASGTSYGPFVDLLRSHFTAKDAVRSEQPPALAAAIRAELCALRDASFLADDEVEEIGPLLGNLLSVTFGDDWDERLRMADPGQIRHRTFAALRSLFGATARRQPAVLVLEDLHWADRLSLDLIGELLGLLAEHPLLLLCVYRPGREYPSERLAVLAERRCADRYTELRLHPLTADESRLLLASLLTVEGLPPKAREVIVAQAEGNPFFTEEIVRGLIDAGLLYRADSTWRAQERIEIARAPEGVQSVILSRVDRLAAEDKQVLQAAAVLGRVFRLPVLAHLVPPGFDLRPALDRLAERDFVYLERTWPEAEVSFKHVLTQEAVYGTLLAGRKTQLHRQAGEAIETLYAGSLAEHYEVLAHHYDRGDVNEKAVEYLLKAGEKARRAYLSDEAIGYFERALARLDRAGAAPGVSSAARDEAGLAALVGLGQIHFVAGRWIEAEAWLRQATTLGRQMNLPPSQLARLYYWLSDVLFWQDRLDEMVALGEEGLRLFGAGESVETALMHGLISWGMFLSDSAARWQHVHYLADVLPHLLYCEELRAAYQAVANYYRWHVKACEAGMRWSSLMVEQARQHHDLRLQVAGLYSQGNMQTGVGDLRAAGVLLHQAAVLATRIGDIPSMIMVADALRQHILFTGDIEQSDQSVIARIFGELGAPARWVQGLLAVWQATCQVCVGEHSSLREARRETAAYMPLLPPNRRGDVAEWLGRSAWILGERSEAMQWYQEALSIVHLDAAKELVWTWWPTNRPRFVNVLGGLEVACADGEAFRALCRRCQESGIIGPGGLQWRLEPATGEALEYTVSRAPGYAAEFADRSLAEWLAEGWEWQNPLGDCTAIMRTGRSGGLIIAAANGRDLYWVNYSAPRLVRPAAGDFIVETVCSVACDDRPTMGGLLFWRDTDHYLLLDWGRGGPGELLLEGCLDGVDRVWGRGYLPGTQITLRFQRSGGEVTGFCSADGETWWSVGHTAFPAADPVQIGVCAIGMIDRTIYPGAYREGTAIRFEAFRMW